MTVQACALTMIGGGQSEKVATAVQGSEEVKAAHSVTRIYEVTAFEGPAFFIQAGVVSRTRGLVPLGKGLSFPRACWCAHRS